MCNVRGCGSLAEAKCAPILNRTVGRIRHTSPVCSRAAKIGHTSIVVDSFGPSSDPGHCWGQEQVRGAATNTKREAV